MMTTREKRLGRLRKRKRPEWPIAERFYESEMKVVINHIRNEEVDPRLRKSLRKYLIIACTTLIEVFLSHLIKRTIDENKLPISTLINQRSENDANRVVSNYGKLIGTTLTKGEYVGSVNTFANPKEINRLFTALLKIDNSFRKLNVDFFQAARKTDWYRPFKFVKGTRSMHLNWNKFEQLFEIRTRIVHDMDEVNISDGRLFSLAENTMSFLEAAIFIVDPGSRPDVIEGITSKKPYR